MMEARRAPNSCEAQVSRMRRYDTPLVPASRGWVHSIRYASKLYWTAQVALSLALALVTVFVVSSAGHAGASVSAQGATWASAVFDAVILLAATHLVIRPVLRAVFVMRRATLKSWGLLAMTLLGCSAITAFIGEPLISSSTHAATVEEVRFHTGTSEFGVALVGWRLFAMQTLNALFVYGLWSAVYLAWTTSAARRELRRQVRQARVWQLTRQMGPHFLFNALNSIRGLIYEDRDRAAQLLTRFSDLMRIQLGQDDETHQPLRRECQIAQDYLAIELVRLGPRLTFSFDVPADCEEFDLPALTVLTAVENAVKHGIAPNPHPGWIRVSAHRGTRGWVLEVANSYGVASRAESTGLGLRNLRERLLLSTEGSAKVEHWKEQESFHVRLELPA